MDTTGTFYCAYCNEPSVTTVDISAGLEQRYVEDCQVCCQPNQLYVRFDEEDYSVVIDTDPAQ
ncbi:CPXCG motif-containing cysteine-rich protein [Anthocerotibacter panamensis]|uniref:CPXCG motif-containing cysteine-rich protein n=1 Tax=Anthocerotibacter panamensis TaxID=2857077 RepID=UPI001C40828E|nr:CPXCG motif-containing cysteine-rich protein [Anthocerotibacter panamensis]